MCCSLGINQPHRSQQQMRMYCLYTLAGTVLDAFTNTWRHTGQRVCELGFLIPCAQWS